MLNTAIARARAPWLDDFNVVSRGFALALLLVWLGAQVAQAQVADGSARLVWTRAADASTCIDGVALESAVEAHLNADTLNNTDQSTTVIEGHVERLRGARGFVASVSLSRDGIALGTRQVRVRGGNCRKLDDALVLVIALTLQTPSSNLAPPAPVDRETRSFSLDVVESDVERTQAQADVAASDEASEPDERDEPDVTPAPSRVQPTRPAPPTRPVSPTRPSRAPRPSARASTTTRPTAAIVVATPARADQQRDAEALPASDEPLSPLVDLSLGGSVALGWMPAPAFGVNAGLALHAGARVRIEAAGVLWPFGERPTDQGSVRFVIGYGQARLCPLLWSTSRMQIDGCVAGLIGAVHGAGDQFVSVRSDSRLLLGVAGLARVAAPLGRRVALRLVFELDAPLTRDRFGVQRADRSFVQLHRLPVLAGSLGAELVLSL